MIPIAQTLKTARLDIGMSIDEAASFSEIDAHYIVALEAGTVSRPARLAVFFLAGLYFISFPKVMEMGKQLRALDAP